MSITRQQRRAMERKTDIFNGFRKVQARENSRQQKAREIAQKILPELKEDWEPRIKKKAITRTLIIAMAYMHIDKRHTGKYLEAWIKGFNEFADAFQRSGEDIETLEQILLEECGLAIEIRD